jgi:hypothetical protein
MRGGENKSESELERQVADLMELGRDEPVVDALKPEVAEPLTPPGKASFDDKLTEKAIDDITKSESDELQNFEDSEDDLPLDPTIQVNDHPHRKLKITIWSVVLALIALGVAYLNPASRYWAFNLVGLRASASLLVVDSVSRTPIDSAKISVGGTEFVTDKNGRANLSNVKLGPSDLNVSRLAYAPLNRSVTIDLGNNKFGQISLDPVVVDYKVNIKNAISQQPITGVMVKFLDQTVKSDLSGQAILPLKGQQADNLEAELSKTGFNDKTVTLNSKNAGAVNVQLVPEGRDYYIGSTGGDQGVVSVNLDGSDPKLAFSANKADISTSNLSVSPSAQFIAIVGTNGNGDKSLVIVNTATGSYQFLARGDDIKFYGWLGGNVVYAIGSKCSSDMCYRLNLTDVNNGSGWEPSGFAMPDAVVIVGDEVAFATAQNQNNSTAVVYLANGDGTFEQEIAGGKISKIERVSTNDILISASSGQRLFDMASRTFVGSDSIDTESSRQFIDGTSNAMVAWVSQKSGQYNLMVQSGTGQPKSDFLGTNQLTPLRFIGEDYLIFKQQGDSGFGDYIYSIASGKTSKIIDLSS